MTKYGIVGSGYFGADLARSLEKIKDLMKYLKENNYKA